MNKILRKIGMLGLLYASPLIAWGLPVAVENSKIESREPKYLDGRLVAIVTNYKNGKVTVQDRSNAGWDNFLVDEDGDGNLDYREGHIGIRYGGSIERTKPTREDFVLYNKLKGN